MDNCGDCQNFRQCEWLFNCDPDSTVCDWEPSRFLRKGKTAHNEFCNVFVGLPCDCDGGKRAPIREHNERVVDFYS